MSDKVWNAIQEALQFCNDNKDRNYVLLSYPPQHHFSKNITVEAMAAKINEIKAAYIEETAGAPNMNAFAEVPISTVCKPLVSFLESYKEHGGPISPRLMDAILGYCSSIETNYQKMREHEAAMYANYTELQEMVKEYIS